MENFLHEKQRRRQIIMDKKSRLLTIGQFAAMHRINKKL